MATESQRSRWTLQRFHLPAMAGKKEMRASWACSALFAFWMGCGGSLMNTAGQRSGMLHALATRMGFMCTNNQRRTRQRMSLHEVKKMCWKTDIKKWSLVKNKIPLSPIPQHLFWKKIFVLSLKKQKMTFYTIFFLFSVFSWIQVFNEKPKLFVGENITSQLVLMSTNLDD